MVNGCARLELFARPHNQREGLLGVDDEAILVKPNPEKAPVVVNVPVVANDGAVVAAENNELLFNVLGETVIANTIKK